LRKSGQVEKSGVGLVGFGGWGGGGFVVCLVVVEGGGWGGGGVGFWVGGWGVGVLVVLNISHPLGQRGSQRGTNWGGLSRAKTKEKGALPGRVASGRPSLVRKEMRKSAEF